MATLTLSRALPLSHLATEGLNAATSDKRIEVINTLFQAWNESKNSQITQALQERVTLEKDPTCLARLQEVLGVILPMRCGEEPPSELAQLQLKAQAWEIDYWQKRARRFEKQVREANDFIKKDRAALLKAQKQLQKTIRAKKQATLLAIATGTGAIVLDAVTGNIPGAVIATTVMIGKVAWIQRRLYEKGKTLSAVNEQLSTPLVHSVSNESLDEEETLISQLSEAEWAFIKPNELPSHIQEMTRALREGTAVDSLAENYGLDLLFLLEFIDSYQLSFSAKEKQLQPAYLDFEHSVKSLSQRNEVSTHKQRIGRYLRLQHLGIGGYLKPIDSLVGRIEEQKELKSWFDQFKLQAGTSVMWVSGDPGVGKSALIEDFKQSVLREKGLFALGKFDQQRQDALYGPFQTALSPLVQALLALPTDQQKSWKTRIEQRLGSTTYIITRLFPALEKMLGALAPTEEVSADAFKNQVSYAFTEFVNLLASEQPLVFCFDDLQWVDDDSLRLFEKIISHEESTGKVMILGSYRKGEVPAEHPLALAKGRLEKVGSLPQKDLAVSPLTPEHIQELVDRLLTSNRAAPLAHYLYSQTGGNPFYTLQLLNQLQQEGYLYFSAQQGSWGWEMEAIHQWAVPNDLKELMQTRFSRLSPATESLLKWASCLGHTFDADLLAAAMKNPLESVQIQLEEAVAAGLIAPILLPTDDPEKFVRTTYYQFAHDQVQSTADLRLTEEERRLIHFTLGETLYLYTQEDDLPSVITQMVSHINVAQFGTNWHLITSADPNAHFLEKEEQIELAHFNGQAAQQVYEEGDFNAAGHFAQIALILFPTVWKEDHALAVQLHTILSQYHFLNRRLNDGITLSSKLLKEAKNDTDRLAAFKLQYEGYTALDDLERGSLILVSALEIHRERLPLHPSKMKLAIEFIKAKRALYRLDIQAALNTEFSSKPQDNRVFRLLTDLYIVAQYTNNSPLALLAGLRAIQLSIDENRFVGSPEVLNVAALFLVLQGDFAKAYEYEKLALHCIKNDSRLTLLDKVRFYSRYSLWSLPWLHGCKEGYETAKNHQDTYTQSGDFLSIAFGRFTQNVYRRYEDLSISSQKIKNDMEASLLPVFSRMIISTVQLQRALQGKTERLTSLNDGEFNGASDILNKAEVSNIAKARVFWKESSLNYLAEQYEEALRLSEKAKKLRVLSFIATTASMSVVVHGLALAACYRIASSPLTKLSYSRTFDALNKQIVVWAEGNFTSFGGHYLAFLANKASVLGPQVVPEVILQKYMNVTHSEITSSNTCLGHRKLDADELFDMALKVLDPDYPFLEFDGFIYLSAAAHHIDQGTIGKRAAKDYLKMAYDLFVNIGATAAVKFLEENSRYKDLIAEISSKAM